MRRPWRLRETLVVGFGFLFVLVAVEKGASLLAAPENSSLWYALPGLSLALLLGFGLHFLPAVLLGSLTVALWVNPPPLPILSRLALALSSSVAYGLGAAALRRWLRMDPRMQRIRDVVSFVVIAALIAMLPAAMPLLFSEKPAQWLSALSAGWFQEMISLIVLAPFLLVHVVSRARRALRLDSPLVRRRTGARERSPGLRRTLVILTEIAICALILWVAMGPVNSRRLHYLCFLPLIEVALRHGLPGTTIAVPAIAGANGLSVRLYGLGSDPPLSLPIFVLTLSLTGLLTGTVVTARTKAEWSLQRRTQELMLLNRAVGALISTLDLDQVLSTVLEEVRQVLGVTSTSVWLVDPRTGDLVCRQVTGPHSQSIRGLRLASGQGLAGWAVRTGQSLIVPDTETDPRHLRDIDKQTGLGVHSVITVPLEVKGQVIGVLQAVDQEVDRFGPADLALLEPMAATAAIAIENARLYEQARQDADTKSLLLREVNHRVKNILTTVVGLLFAELRYARPKVRSACQSLLEELVGRIQGLSTVHTMLSTSEWQPLPLSELTVRVIQSALQMTPRGKHISVEVTRSPVRVTPEQAHHLALVLNELAVNTLKHALCSRETARIQVYIRTEADTIVLEFRDDGPGYPEDVLRLERHGVGFDLVQNLIYRGLHGTFSLRNEDGAVTEIRFQVGVGET